jgi:hypothetical protein
MATLLVAGAAAAEEKAYEILLDRPTKPGAAYRVVTTGTNVERQVITAAGLVVEDKQTEVSVELSASVVVLGVDEHGRASKVKLLVDTSSIRRGEERSEPFAKGTEVIMSVEEGQERYTVGGEAVPPDVAKALRLVDSLPTTDETDDEVFGTKEKKRVGDSWPVDSKRAGESFREPGMTIADEAITGETKLVAVTNVDGTEALTIEARIVMDGIGMDMPADFKVTESRLEAGFKGTFPVDLSRGRLDTSLTGSMVLKATGTNGPGGPEVTIEATGRRTRTTKFLEP